MFRNRGSKKNNLQLFLSQKDPWGQSNWEASPQWISGYRMATACDAMHCILWSVQWKHTPPIQPGNNHHLPSQKITSSVPWPELVSFSTGPLDYLFVSLALYEYRTLYQFLLFGPAIIVWPQPLFCTITSQKQIHPF